MVPLWFVQYHPTIGTVQYPIQLYTILPFFKGDFEKEIGLFIWGYEQPGVMEGVPVRGCGVGIRWSLRSIPSQTILPLYDLGAHYLFQGAIANCKIIYFLVFPEPLENKSCIPDCWNRRFPTCWQQSPSSLPLSHSQSLWDNKSVPLRKSPDSASLSPAWSCRWALSPNPLLLSWGQTLLSLSWGKN